MCWYMAVQQQVVGEAGLIIRPIGSCICTSASIILVEEMRTGRRESFFKKTRVNSAPYILCHWPKWWHLAELEGQNSPLWDGWLGVCAWCSFALINCFPYLSILYPLQTCTKWNKWSFEIIADKLAVWGRFSSPSTLP